MRFGSIRHTLPARRLDSHTEPWPTRMASPPGPWNCCATVLVAGSMRVIGYSNDVTHTERSPTAISPGPGMPARIVATTLLVFTSTRLMLPSAPGRVFAAGFSTGTTSPSRSPHSPVRHGERPAQAVESR